MKISKDQQIKAWKAANRRLSLESNSFVRGGIHNSSKKDQAEKQNKKSPKNMRMD